MIVRRPLWASVPAALSALLIAIPVAAQDTVMLSLGDLPPGESLTVTFDAMLSDLFPAGVESVFAQGTVSGDNFADVVTDDPDTVAADDPTETPVIAAPDLTVAKDDGGAIAQPGQTVAYTIMFSNAGNQDATGVVISEEVPANTTFNPAASTPGWICVPDASAGSVCTLSVGAVAAGGSGAVTFAGIVDAFVPMGVTEISNTVEIGDDGANGADPNPADNFDTVTTPLIAFEGDQSLIGWTYLGGGAAAGALGPLFPGDPSIAGTLQADDDGDASGADMNTSIGDPAGMSFVSWVSPGGLIQFVDQDTLLVEWTLSASFATPEAAPTVRMRWFYDAVGAIGGGELFAHPTVAPSSPTGLTYRAMFDQLDVAGEIGLVDPDGIPNSGDEFQRRDITLIWDTVDFETGVGGGSVEMDSVFIMRLNRAALRAAESLESIVSDFTSTSQFQAPPGLNWSAESGVTFAFTGLSEPTLTASFPNTLQDPAVIDLFGNANSFAWAGMGMVPFSPSATDGQVYRAEFVMSASPNVPSMPMPLVEMFLATFRSGSQLYSAKSSVTSGEGIPLPATSPLSRPAVVELPGTFSTYLMLPAGTSLGGSLGDEIGASLRLVDFTSLAGGTLTLTSLSVSSFPESLLP